MIHTFAEWLRHTPLSMAIWSSLSLIRLLQATHLLMAGVVTVSGLMIALRALGWRLLDEPFEAVWRRFAPWLCWSFTLMLLTGIGQTLGDPVREFTATSWWLKMILVLCCMSGTLLISRRPHDAAPSFAMKLLLIGLILGWLLIPLLGRMIAYDLPFWGRLSLRT